MPPAKSTNFTLTMLKFSKLILGFLLLPLAAGLTMVFAETFSDESNIARLDHNGAWFAGGFIVWLLLFGIFPKPMRTYVLAHELTHALWGLLMGAKVSRLRVSAKGGSVTLNKSNVLITLAPYFFPFYMVLALGVYLLVNIWIDTRAYQPFWFAVFGLCWSFHLCFTLHTLGTHQPDIQEHGRIFSYVVIYSVNLVTAAALLNFLTARPWPELGKAIVRDVSYCYACTTANVMKTVSLGAERAQNYLK